jgi:hypothetical protein
LFLKDPVLRRIAAATGDVWPDRMWRFDTVDGGSHGELAMLLLDTSLRFSDSADHLNHVLAKASRDLTRLQQELASHVHSRAIGSDRLFVDLLAAIERHIVLEQQLLRQYAVWRSHGGSPALHGHAQMLVKAGDPSWGVITLWIDDGDHWPVLPDEEAAACFDIGDHAGKTIGTITPTGSLFQPTAHTNADPPGIEPEQVSGFAACDDLQAACRSLLRWHRYRDSADWDGRYPTDFTLDELTALTE